MTFNIHVEGKNMKIIKSNIENIENDKKMLYRLTKGTALSLSQLDDEQLDQSWPVDAYLIYEDTNQSGTTNTIISILSGHTVLSGQSQPFRDSFLEIVEIMEDEPFSIHIVHRISGKNKRKYVTCTLDC